MTSSAPAHILVADDDPVSLLFLASTLRELGWEVTTVANGMAALAACEKQQFDLLLLDRRMPDLGGGPLLRSLRERGHLADAIATSAELDTGLRDELQAAGYVDALRKPIGVDRLAGILAQRVHGRATNRAHEPSTRAATDSAANLLDDAGALAGVGGDARTLRALRRLLRQELETTIPLIAANPPQMSTQDLRGYLHRLRASCRYCGTPLLAAAAARLEAQPASDDPSIQVELADFVSACKRTSAALAAQLSPEVP